MSKLRPCLGDAKPGTYIPRGTTALMMVLGAVKTSSGLIHGRLHDHGESCAIGHYFNIHQTKGLASDLIDEVAAVNDSVPLATPKQRRRIVLIWLRSKLRDAGIIGV